MFVVFGIEYWAGNPNFSCCSLITSSGNGFCVLLHPEGNLSYPQVPWARHSPARESIWSFSRDLPNPTRNLGAPGIPFWWLLWKPPHVPVLSVHSTSHSTPGRTTTPVIVSEWPCAVRQPKSYLNKNTCTLPKWIQIPLASAICFLRVWWSYHFFPNAS